MIMTGTLKPIAARRMAKSTPEMSPRSISITMHAASDVAAALRNSSADAYNSVRYPNDESIRAIVRRVPGSCTTTEITYCCTGKGSVRDGVAIALALLFILAGCSRLHPQRAGWVSIPPTGVLQRRALGEGGCASDADRVALGRARRKRLIRAARRRPARYLTPPKRARK